VQPADVHEVSQGSEPQLRGLLRALCYPLW
jgi:hypothetical protein